MSVISIQTKNDWDELLEAMAQYEAILIVDFFAHWCGPCRLISPFFEQLADDDDYDDSSNLKFGKVDVDDNEEVAQLAGVTAMPTFQVWKNKECIETLVGADKEKLEQLVKKHALKGDNGNGE